jgi:hypothetical protein
MKWGQNITVFTDHANLMRYALGLTLDGVYRWRLLLEGEYGPKIVYTKDIHNTVADAVLQLEYDPSVNQTAESFHTTKVRNKQSRQRQCWMTVSKNWCKLDINSDNLDSYTNKYDDWNIMFAHHEEEYKIYPLTFTEIADAQHKEELRSILEKNAKMPQKDIGLHLIEDTKVLCKNGKIIIPTFLRHRAVSWYHHYLQHPWALMSRRDNEIHDVLERYAYYHPGIRQNLPILPSQ